MFGYSASRISRDLPKSSTARLIPSTIEIRKLAMVSSVVGTAWPSRNGNVSVRRIATADGAGSRVLGICLMRTTASQPADHQRRGDDRQYGPGGPARAARPRRDGGLGAGKGARARSRARRRQI